MTHKKRLGLYIGAVAVSYGLISLVFEIFNTSYNAASFWLWAILNPLFVATIASGVSGMSMSLFANFSTQGMGVATLIFWVYPLAFIGVGVVAAYPIKKK